MFRHWFIFATLLLLATGLFNSPLQGQEEKSPSWIISTDLVSSYIWRGTKQGSGPHLQPMVEYSYGSFTGGAWGTFDLHGYKEVDIWLAFDLPGGFSISLQDYWMADLPLADFSAETGSHVVEASAGFDSGHVSFFGAYIFNEAGGAGSYGGDLYLESRFSFDYFTIFMGAGNGWHTEEGSFRACSIGLEVSRDIPLTHLFEVPVTVQAVYNPDSHTMFFTAGLSLSTGTGK